MNSPPSALPGKSRLNVGGTERGMLREGVVVGMISYYAELVYTYKLNMYDTVINAPEQD